MRYLAAAFAVQQGDSEFLHAVRNRRVYWRCEDPRVGCNGFQRTVLTDGFNGRWSADEGRGAGGAAGAGAGSRTLPAAHDQLRPCPRQDHLRQQGRAESARSQGGVGHDGAAGASGDGADGAVPPGQSRPMLTLACE
eukprot:2982677-Rhodomonas_salina.1